MRVDKRFGTRVLLMTGLVAAGVSVFGASPVRTQTLPPQPAAAAAQGPVRGLSMADAVALALEQNLDLQVSRINPQLQDLSIATIRSGYSPNFSSNITFVDQSQPPTDTLGGNLVSLNTNQNRYNFGLGALTKWGGTYNAGFNNLKLTTNNANVTANPQLQSVLNLNFTQPLLRNFKIDSTRQQLLLGLKNREISDVELQQSIAITVRSVRNAYYDLMFAIGNLNVQRESFQLAQRSLKDNRSRVEIGTMAPIDIVEAESEVAQREESVIVAEAAISQSEDTLRALVFNPGATDFWTMKLEPTETAIFQAVTVDPEAAVRAALDQRTDLKATRKELESNDVNIRFFRNQLLPDMNASLTYGAQAVGGTRFIRSPVAPFPITGQVDTSYGSTLQTLYGADFPSWTLGMQVNYPLGSSNAEANLARSRLQNLQAQKQLQSQELQVATQVRQFARQVQTNTKRVDATRASRGLAERRLEAEEKKFQAGMTTSFLVFQAQRDLNQARNNELQALLDHAKSVVSFETSQIAPLGSTGGLSTSTTGNTGINGTNSTTGTTGRQQQQQQQQQQ